MGFDSIIEYFEMDEIEDFGVAREKFLTEVDKQRGRNFNKKLENFGKEIDRMRLFDKKLKTIRSKGINYLNMNPQKSISLAFSCSVYLVSKDLKRSQIRNILELMSNVNKRNHSEESLSKEIARIRFMLAYTAGRMKQTKPLEEILDPLLSQVRSKEDFNTVYEFFQSIVAFHYFLGGGD